MYKKEAKPELFTERMTSHDLPTGITRDTVTDLLRTPVCDLPTKEKLKQINEKHDLGIPDHELEKYRDVISKVLMNFDRLEEYIEPKPEVKFARLPGRLMAPKEKENAHNAWLIKTTIKGNTTGKLQNKKLVVKDNIPVAGLRMTAGSKLLEGFVPEFDATVVTKVLEHGVTITGKANCEDLCDSGNSFTCKRGPVLNAKDTTRSAGGSSSGPAVLVALNEVDMALATDFGGHLRVPAAWNGVVGMKPTYGLVPFTGILSKEPTLDHVGPIAKTVTDCAALLETIAIKDRGTMNALCDIRQPSHHDDHKHHDSMNQLDVLPYKITDKLNNGDIKGLKIGLITESFKGCETDVNTTVTAAAKKLLTAGAACVEEVSIPMHEDGECIHLPIDIEGFYKTIVKEFGVPMLPKGFHSTDLKDALAGRLHERMKDTSVITKLMVLMGSFLKEKYHDRFYSRAQNLTQLLKKSYDDAFKKYDILITPTTKFKAPKLPKWTTTNEQNIPELHEILHQMLGMFSNTCPFNLTGHPALTINSGMSANLPIGMQLIGREFEDATVLRTALAFEKVRGF